MRRATLLALLLVVAAQLRAEPRHSILAGGAATIEYLEEGSGPAIVMVASLGRGADDFDGLASRLGPRGFHTIAPNPRGVGQSTAPLSEVSLHDYAADIATVIERAGIGPVVVLGHAYGNTVARTLATDRPDLVRGVILVAASGRAPLDAPVREAIAKASDLALPEADRARSLARAYFAPGHDPSPWLAGWHPDVQAAQWRAFNRSKPDDYLAAGGRVPILDLQGADDVIIPPRYSLDLQNELGPRVTVVVLQHAGHALLPEQPDAAADAITQWMRATFPGDRVKQPQTIPR